MGYVLGDSPWQALDHLACCTRQVHPDFGLPLGNPSNFSSKTPILIPFDPNSLHKICYWLTYIKRQSKHLQIWIHNLISSQNHHQTNFSPKTHIFTFSSKLHKQQQFKPQQHTNIYNHLSSEFRHVWTIITHKFKTYTQLSKNHQNNLFQTSTMNLRT